MWSGNFFLSIILRSSYITTTCDHLHVTELFFAIICKTYSLAMDHRCTEQNNRARRMIKRRCTTSRLLVVCWKVIKCRSVFQLISSSTFRHRPLLIYSDRHSPRSLFFNKTNCVDIIHMLLGSSYLLLVIEVLIHMNLDRRSRIANSRLTDHHSRWRSKWTTWNFSFSFCGWSQLIFTAE